MGPAGGLTSARAGFLCRRNTLEQVQSGVSADSLSDVQAQAAAREALHSDLAQFVDAARLALGPPFLKVRPLRRVQGFVCSVVDLAWCD